jgi:hypothetical protein
MTENQLFTHGVGILGNLIGLALVRFAWTLTDDPHRWNRRSWAVALAPGVTQFLLEAAFGRWSSGWLETLTYFVPATSVGILSAGLGILHSHPPQSNPRTLRLTLMGILAAALIVSLWPLPRHGWWI